MGLISRAKAAFHNYEGDAIPYDDTFIDKDVEIGKCVWLGNNVIILVGGLKLAMER